MLRAKVSTGEGEICDSGIRGKFESRANDLLRWYFGANLTRPRSERRIYVCCGMWGLN